MASTSIKEDQNEKEISLDASVLNQLMYSVGRLKFTLRSLENMNLQVALLPPEESIDETHPPSDYVHSLESNKILENAIKETLAQRSNSTGKRNCQNSLQDLSSLEDLELVYEKLNNELQKVQLKYQTAFSKKSSKTISIT